MLTFVPEVFTASNAKIRGCSVLLAESKQSLCHSCIDSYICLHYLCPIWMKSHPFPLYAVIGMKVGQCGFLVVILVFKIEILLTSSEDIKQLLHFPWRPSKTIGGDLLGIWLHKQGLDNIIYVSLSNPSLGEHFLISGKQCILN